MSTNTALAGTRFDFAGNLAQATRYRGWTDPYWPPASDYRLMELDLRVAQRAGTEALDAEFATLRDLVEASWLVATSDSSAPSRPIPRAAAVAVELRRIAGHLSRAEDRRSLELRADALEHGYGEEILSALATAKEDVAVVAGAISTWFGKLKRGLPTAFGCVRDVEQQAAVDEATSLTNEIGAYLGGLHGALRFGDLPAFAATSLFFMAGEGDRHPKHIAYFLPEDEGVKRSPFKKTCYLVNTHRALIEGIALPLARRHLDLGVPTPPDAAALGVIPTLGVLAHEMGHAVHRETTSYRALNAADRWASVMLQELVADVCGMLILTDVIAPAFGIKPWRMIAYHLGECCRYVDRGLGHFPDSDGMYLQLSYLTAFGALEPLDDGRPRLAGDPEVVLAGFRSLARVLADTLLAGDVARALALYHDFGPPSGQSRLVPLITALAADQAKSLAYRQGALGERVAESEKA